MCELSCYFLVIFKSNLLPFVRSFLSSEEDSDSLPPDSNLNRIVHHTFSQSDTFDYPLNGMEIDPSDDDPIPPRLLRSAHYTDGEDHRHILIAECSFSEDDDYEVISLDLGSEDQAPFVIPDPPLSQSTPDTEDNMAFCAVRR